MFRKCLEYSRKGKKGKEGKGPSRADDDGVDDDTRRAEAALRVVVDVQADERHINKSMHLCERSDTRTAACFLLETDG